MSTTTTEQPVVPSVETKKSYMTLEQALEIVNKFSLPATRQSGFVRIDGPKGNRVYIAATKTVRRIDISGFEVSMVIAQAPHCGPFGNVKQQLRLEGSVEEQTARLELLLSELQNQPAKVPAPKPEKKAASPKPSSTPTGEESSTGEVAAPPSPEEKRLARLAHIDKVIALATKMGKEPSPKLLAEKAELEAAAPVPASMPEGEPEVTEQAQA